MRKFVAPILLLALGACTPEEHHAFLDWLEQDPQAAIAFAQAGCGPLDCRVEWTDVTVTEDEADIDTPVGEPESWGQCSQWMDDALDAGWTEDQWGTLNWIMAAESNCDPGAYNPSGASGLLQIMPFHVGTTCSNGDLFEPWFNLACGLDVYNSAGWSAWSVY